MPTIYLSPSTQEFNEYANGLGTEEEWMNRLADAMEPQLTASGIRFTRNTPDMTAASSIQASNAGSYDLHLALHTNASGAGQAGRNRGILAFYYPGSRQGERAAEIFVRNLKTIYPLPDQVAARPTTTLGEVRQPHCPAVLLEIGYHDNFADARWIEGNREAIARQLGRSLTEFFGLPFIEPMETRYGTVTLSSGSLLLRSRPEREAGVVTRMPAGASVSVHGEWQGWYVVHYGVYVGYAAAQYIQLG